jgi:hypothetical protein
MRKNKAEGKNESLFHFWQKSQRTIKPNVTPGIPLHFLHLFLEREKAVAWAEHVITF